MLVPISNSVSSSCLGCARPAAGMSGLGLFDSGFDFSGWGLTEWLMIGGGLFALFGGGAAVIGGGKTARRKRLQVARAKYELERATV